MMMKKLALAGLIAAAPGFALAEGVAASLSASFGPPTTTETVDFGSEPLGVLVTSPQSVSVSAAAGAYATASAVATVSSTGALAAASDVAAIIADVSNNGNEYESSVTFGVDTVQIDAYLESVFCENGIPVSGLIDTGLVDGGGNPVFVTAEGDVFGLNCNL